MFDGDRVSAWEEEQFWWGMVETFAQQCECASRLSNCSLKKGQF